MTAPKRAVAGRGWKLRERMPVAGFVGVDADVWEWSALRVLSSLSRMEAPDDSGDVLPTWLVSVSRAGKSMPTDRDLERVRRDFGMLGAEEDNHQDGTARMLFLVVDPSRRVDCECKTTERVVERPDGYRYSVPIQESRHAQ